MPCHFCQISAFTPQEVFHASIAISFSVAKKINIFFSHYNPPRKIYSLIKRKSEEIYSNEKSKKMLLESVSMSGELNVSHVKVA
jgi:hypothetical protein